LNFGRNLDCGLYSRQAYASASLTSVYAGLELHSIQDVCLGQLLIGELGLGQVTFRLDWVMFGNVRSSRS